MTRIGFIGAGAVGGYFGGLMAMHYAKSDEVEIYFVCRKETEQQIAKHGLRLDTTHGNYHIAPLLLSSSNSQDIIFDYVICCTKSYDLESGLISVSSNLANNTIIIPFQNGVNSYEKIKAILPGIEIWDACVYIVSRIIEPAYIKETGEIQSIYFGSRNEDSSRLKSLEQLFVNAGIKAQKSDQIISTIWEKFLFISSIATATSCFDKSIGEILSDEQYKSVFHHLLMELKSLADAKKIPLRKDIIESVYSKMSKLPFEASSSMHHDFRNHRQTELESLTGYVVRMADDIGLTVPVYREFYLNLLNKTVEKQL